VPGCPAGAGSAPFAALFDFPSIHFFSSFYTDAEEQACRSDGGFFRIFV
jgi:hypothetical protein